MTDYKESWVKELKGWNSVAEQKTELSSMVNLVKLVYYIPFGLPFSSGGGHVNISNKIIKTEVEVKQKPRVSSNETDKIPVPAMGMSSSMRMSNDRYGQYNYTSLRFTFKIEPEDQLSNLPSEQFVQESVMAVNKILDSCRMVSDVYVPRNFIRMDIVAYDIEYYNSSGAKVFGTRSFGGAGKQTSNKLFDNEELKKFASFLQSKEALSLEREFLLNAQDYLLFENFRMACVEIQSAVEAVISNKIHSNLQNNRQEEEIEKILKLRWDDLKPHLRDATNQQVIDSVQCRKWREDCAKIRHKVVHRQYVPSPDEARNAVESGKAFIELLENF